MLLFYYSFGFGVKALTLAESLTRQHLLKYITIKNVALAGVLSGLIIFWKSQTSKYHNQMGLTQSTDGTFRRVSMVPQTQAFTPTPATWTKEELINICKQRLVKIANRKLGTGVNGMKYGVDLILTVKHVFLDEKDPEAIFDVWNGTQQVAIKRGLLEIQLIDDTHELCLVRVHQLGGGTTIDKHIFHAFPATISSFDEACYVTFDGDIKPVSSQVVVFQQRSTLSSMGYDSINGDCGLPLLAADKKSWRIVGMHFGNFPSNIFGSNVCLADKIERFRLESAVRNMGMKHIELVPIALQCGNLPIGPTPLTSSLGAYLGTGAKNAMYIGTLQGMRKTTFKSNLKLSPLYPYFKEAIFKECGDELPFVIPTTKGALDLEGHWVDTYTEKMRDPMPESFADDDLLWLAVADYVSGCDLLKDDISVPAVVSEYEAFVGNDQYHVTPTNMNTSAGPPFSRPKNMIITPFREGLSPPLYYDMTPEAAELHASFISSLSPSTAPWVFSTIFVKDEPVKLAKQKIPRLVNNLPFSFNLLLKMHMVGVRSLLRKFCVFFECMVGINIGSGQVCRITSNLIDKGGLERAFEYDFKWFDLTQRGQICAHIARVYYALGFVTGGHADLLYCLVIAAFKVVYCFNSDLVTFGCKNPSGGDNTVENNSICNSLALRYAYFRTLKIPELKKWVANYKLNFFTNPIVSLPTGVVPFRDVIAVSTYGDDGIASSKLDIGVWLNTYIAELGMCITDGKDKTPVVKARPLTQCTFLKRQFTFDKDLPFMIMPLKKEAILRMPMYLLPSALTTTDHMAAICNDILKESVLHGENFYKDMQMIVLEASLKENFHTSSYLCNLPYQERRKQLLDGDLITWTNGMERHPLVIA